MEIWQHYSGQVLEGNVSITLADIFYLRSVSLLTASAAQHLYAMLIFKGGRLSYCMRVACRNFRFVIGAVR